MVQEKSDSNRQETESCESNSTQELHREGNALSRINFERSLKGKRPLTRLPGPPDPNRFKPEQDINNDGVVAFAINSNERSGLTLEQINAVQGDSRQVNSVDLPSNIGAEKRYDHAFKSRR